ncbi:MAG: chemotaxis protein CheC [Paenibacillaceae bacterium]|nr:chemotaxis protein CheC [Paenibacillaceae bacterium]
MKDPYTFQEIEIDVLREIGNIGAAHAATSLSTLLGVRIDMEVPRANVVGFEEITNQVGGPEAVVVAVFLQVVGEAPGNLFFLLEFDVAIKLLRHLPLSEEIGSAPMRETTIQNGTITRIVSLSDLERSAISEIGNIMAGSYLASLADFTKLHLEPTTPMFTVDMAGAILAYGLIQIGNMGDQALLIETSFFDGDEAIKGHFFFIPEPESLPIIFRSLGIGSA